MDLEGRIDRLYDALSQSKSENEMLRKQVIDFDRARVVLGIQAVDHAIETAKEYERIYAQQKTTKKSTAGMPDKSRRTKNERTIYRYGTGKSILLVVRFLG
ncbi:MAG: hypothetical protein ACLTLY_09510 [Agathobacter rectalis]